MKLIEMQKCPLCGMMRCDHSGKGHAKICKICHHYPCDCNEEQEEAEYNGNKIMVGKHKDESDTRYDAHELMMGIEHELQFTGDNKRTAKSIAKDHLSQMPTYYSDMKKTSFKNFMESDDWEEEKHIDVTDVEAMYKQQAAACHELELAVKTEAQKQSDPELTNCANNYNFHSLPKLAIHVAPMGNKLMLMIKRYPKLRNKWDRMQAMKKIYELAGGRYGK